MSEICIYRGEFKGYEFVVGTGLRGETLYHVRPPGTAQSPERKYLEVDKDAFMAILAAIQVCQ